jgi:hypothetical protein
MTPPPHAYLVRWNGLKKDRFTAGSAASRPSLRGSGSSEVVVTTSERGWVRDTIWSASDDSEPGDMFPWFWPKNVMLACLRRPSWRGKMARGRREKAWGRREMARDRRKRAGEPKLTISSPDGSFFEFAALCVSLSNLSLFCHLSSWTDHLTWKKQYVEISFWAAEMEEEANTEESNKSHHDSNT